MAKHKENKRGTERKVYPSQSKNAGNNEQLDCRYLFSASILDSKPTSSLNSMLVKSIKSDVATG